VPGVIGNVEVLYAASWNPSALAIEIEMSKNGGDDGF